MYTAPLSLSSTATALRTGQLDLLTHIQNICQHIDDVEPHISALLPEMDRRERLLAEARDLQQRFPEPESRPLLYGVLVGVKDIFRVDGFPTGAGSQLPPALFAGPEASCVTKLREAGALILGKTVSTEFAYFEPGPTRNPHNPQHTPGGSSSGSTAGVAAGYFPLALGTQTIGSVIRPAAFCGIVGFKPSYERIARDGLLPCAESLDTVGYFAQDVAGIAPVALLICEDWRPAESDTAPALPVLGVPEGPYLRQTSEEGLAAFERQVRSLEKAGYTVRRAAALQDIEEINARHMRLVFGEMARVHAQWFAQYEPLYRSRTAAAIREGQTVDSTELARCRDGRSALRHELEALMDSNGIDIWICPSAPGFAPAGIDSTGSPLMNLPWTHAGMPAVGLPVARAANGLPLGLQCVGRFMEDEQLLKSVEGLAQASSIA